MPGLEKGDYKKAPKTLEVLHLNDRDILIVARNAAAKYFFQRLELLSRIIQANSVSEIEAILTPYDNFNMIFR